MLTVSPERLRRLARDTVVHRTTWHMFSHKNRELTTGLEVITFFWNVLSAKRMGIGCIGLPHSYVTCVYIYNTYINDTPGSFPHMRL